LTTASLSLEGTLDGGNNLGPEEGRAYLEMARQEIGVATARVRNLLELSRFEMGAPQIKTEITDLTDVLNAAVSRMKLKARDRSVRLSLPDDELLVECDPYRIEMVLINLLENAFKYSPEGSPVILEVTRDGDFVRVAVIDKGPGILPHEREQIFESFYRSDAVKGKEGTGLGLAICSAIVKAHGGSIGALADNKGGHFWFTLNLSDAPA